MSTDYFTKCCSQSKLVLPSPDKDVRFCWETWELPCSTPKRGCQAACISLAAWTPGPGPHWRLRRWRPGTPGPRGPRILPGQPPESRRRPGSNQSRAGRAGCREVRRRHPTGLLDAGITLRLTGPADHGFPRSNCRASRQGKRLPTYKPKDPNRIPPPLTARPRGTTARHSRVTLDQSAGSATREQSPALQRLVTGRPGRMPGGTPPASQRPPRRQNDPAAAYGLSRSWFSTVQLPG